MRCIMFYLKLLQSTEAVLHLGMTVVPLLPADKANVAGGGVVEPLHVLIVLLRHYRTILHLHVLQYSEYQEDTRQ